MSRNDKDERELNDFITSTPEQLEDVWKSKQTRFWNIKTILIALVILISLSLCCIYLYWTSQNKDDASTENFSDLSDLSNETESQTDSTESCKNLPYEYKDEGSQIIRERLEARINEVSEANGTITYEQHFSTFDDQFISELSQSEPVNPYNYFIALDKITWSIPCTHIDPELRYKMETEFKEQFGNWLYAIVNFFMKDFHRKIKQGSQFCMTMKINPDENRLTFGSIQTDLSMDSHYRKTMNQYFANAFYNNKFSHILSSYPVETQWCYSIYNVEREKVIAQKQIPQSDIYPESVQKVYPEIVKKSTIWRHTNSDSPEEENKLFESLIEQKIEQLRQDIGACLVDYPNDWLEIIMLFDISSFGGPITFVEDESDVFFKSNKNTMNLFKCLKMGDVLPKLMNDFPSSSYDTPRLKVVFEVNGFAKDELKKTIEKLELDIPTDPKKMSKEDQARLVKETLVQFNDTLQKACHPALDKVSVKFKLKGNGRADNIQLDIDLTPKDSKCIHDQISKYKFPPLGGSDVPVTYTFLFKKE